MITDCVKFSLLFHNLLCSCFFSLQPIIVKPAEDWNDEFTSYVCFHYSQLSVGVISSLLMFVSSCSRLSVGAMNSLLMFVSIVTNCGVMNSLLIFVSSIADCQLER